MEAFRAENLFGPVDVDDVNIGDESFLCSAESNDEVSVFDEHKIDDEEYVDDVESDPQFEDASQNFRHDSREMRERASSGWELYDQDRCGKTMIYRIRVINVQLVLCYTWHSRSKTGRSYFV